MYNFLAVQHERGPRKSKLQGSKEHHAHHLHHHPHHSHHHANQLNNLNVGGGHLTVGSMLPQNMAAAGSFLAHQQAHHTSLAQAAAAHHQAAAASLHHSLAAAAAAKAAIAGGNKILPPLPAPPNIIPGHPPPPVPPHPPFLFPFAALAAARHQQQQVNNAHTIHHPTALFSPAFQLGLQPPSTLSPSVSRSMLSKPGSPIVTSSALPTTSNTSLSPSLDQCSNNQTLVSSLSSMRNVEFGIDGALMNGSLDSKMMPFKAETTNTSPSNAMKHFSIGTLNNNNNE